MNDALLYHRLHFAFTVTYHYLFPQLTMGLTLLIVILKTLALRTGEAVWNDNARFWAKILGISFAMGVVTGIPMEFQFGTNWARFADAAGGVIGQTLAMEGMFAFFLESAFLGLLIFGERKLSQRAHWWVAFLVFFGSWLSGYFIIATNAWMQHPVGYTVTPDGAIVLKSFGALVLNPWILWQYTHNMIGAVVTGSFVMASVAAFYLLTGRHVVHARAFLKVAVVVGLVASVLQAFPTGDRQAYNVAEHQPEAFAGMEGLFHTERGAPIVLVGQPNMTQLSLDNPLYVPKMLSFLTHRRFDAEVQGLMDFPREDWPDNIPLLYYAYHIMVGLGTIFIALMFFSGLLLWRGRLHENRPMLWALMLAMPFPFIANTAGWLTAELGRQPWVIWKLMRTAGGYSQMVSAGNTLFTLLGFMGMYTVLSILFLFLVRRLIEQGPGTASGEGEA